MSIFSSEREPLLGVESKNLAVDMMAEYMANGHSEYRQRLNPFAGRNLGFSHSPYVPENKVFLLPRNYEEDQRMSDELLRRIIMERLERRARRFVMLDRMRSRPKFRPVNAKFEEYFHVKNMKLRGLG